MLTTTVNNSYLAQGIMKGDMKLSGHELMVMKLHIPLDEMINRG